MLSALQSEETLLASAYTVGIQAKEKNYFVCVAWRDMVSLCFLKEGQKYYHIRDRVRAEFVKGYKNGNQV